MKDLRFKEAEERTPQGLEMLEEGLARMGYRVSRSDIIRAWEAYSDTYAAGWLHIESPDDAGCILSHLTED